MARYQFTSFGQPVSSSLHNLPSNATPQNTTFKGGAPIGTNQLVNHMVNNAAGQIPALAATSVPAPTGQFPINPNGNPGIVPPPVPAAIPPQGQHNQAEPPIPVYGGMQDWRAARPQYNPNGTPGSYHDSLQQWRQARPRFNSQPGGGIMAALNGPSPSITDLAARFPQLAQVLGSDPAQYKTNLAAAMQQHGIAPDMADTMLNRIQF